MTNTTFNKVRENKVRRAAERQGLTLQKSRRRDPRAYDFGRYILVDGRSTAVVVGGGDLSFTADLDEVEAYLNR